VDTQPGTKVDEIADGIFRISTLVPELGPTGFTFNQFVVRGDDKSLLFHTGPRGMFPSVSAAVATVTPLEQLRWITFGHFEADECGAMNEFLAAAPSSQVAHSALGCMVSVADQATREPLPMTPDTVIDLGGKRLRAIDTPHVPHAWDAHVLYEETTATLFCGDLLSHLGDGPALTSNDVVGPAAEAEDMFGSTCLTPATAPTIRGLVDLAPTTLAIMHGSSYTGDAAAPLLALADEYEHRLHAAAR
jgi:flavorubredoxin